MESLSNEEVEKTIEKILSATNPHEISFKGLYLGRLCYKAEKFDLAADWIIKYLQKFDRDFQAYRLLGECYEKLSKFDHALSNYRQSLQLKPNQYDLVIHLAKLFLLPGPFQNLTKAQVWLDKAVVALPGDSDVFKLKMELLVAQDVSPKTLEEALIQELKLRPNDSSINIDYVSFLKIHDRMEEAFTHCKKINCIYQSSAVDDDCDWHTCLVHTCKEYVDSKTETHISDYCILLEALVKLVWLCISQGNLQKAFQNLKLMDSYLLSVVLKFSINEWQLVVEEIKAQFAWLVGTLLIYQARAKKVSWQETSQLSAFFYSYSLSKPLFSLTSSWAVTYGKSLPKLHTRLHKNSAVRISECCHMAWILNEKLGENQKTPFEDLGGSDKVGKIICHHLFDSFDKSSSFLCAGLLKCNSQPVSIPHMLQYDELSSLNQDLHFLVWLGLRWIELQEAPDYFPWAAKAFPNLKLFTLQTSTTSSFSLNLLDIESFIAGCVFTSKEKLNDWKETTVSDPASLSYSSLPSTLCRRLTTSLQDTWWKAVFELSSKTSKISASEAMKLKTVLQRGLECIRGIGNHGMDELLIAKLAQYFAAKAVSLLDGEKISSAWFLYQRKANSYWTLALPALTRLSEGQSKHRIRAKDVLFPSVFKELSQKEAKTLLSEAYMCRGELATRENRTDEALSLYGKATIPQASFCQAHIYRKMLDDMPEGENASEPFLDVNRKRELLTKKYRHCLEVTLTRLQQYPDDNLHEKTIQLLRSPHVSPPRPSLLKSLNESPAKSPSKQSTPKANISSTAPLIEKEDVNNLVDTITTLTSALSSLQLEMEYLREENRLIRQSSPAQMHNASLQRRDLHQVFTPSMFPGGEHLQPQFTPNRPAFLPDPTLQQSYIRPGISPIPGVFPQISDVYRPQNPPYFNPDGQMPFLPNVAYPYSNGPQLNNDFGMGGYPNVSHHTMPPPFPQATPTGRFDSGSNILAEALQNTDKEALQQKFGSLLSGIQTSNVTKSELPSVFSESSFMSPVTTTLNTSVNSLFNSQTQLHSTTSSKTPLLQHLLSGENTNELSTPVSSKDLKQNFKVSLLPNVTPTTADKEVHFLEKYVSPKSPGSSMKFQSPEQMDRENQELDALEQADADNSPNADTGPHFDPIIPLPDLVEVKTGEEDETVVFEERCKLFRWSDKQWKERGLGLMKILTHKSSGKSRLVMRREQVLKVCCNHNIVETSRLDTMPSCNRAMVWFARDFSENQPKDEKFAAKFKTIEIAEKFRDLVNAEALKLEKAAKQADALNAGASRFKFEIPSKSQSPLANPHGDAKPTPKPSPFSNLANAMSSSGFAGSGPNGGIKLPQTKFSFGAPKPKTKDESEETNRRKSSSSSHNSNSNEAGEKDTSGPHFEPVIDLPDLVDVKSGEEDEDVIFCRRAKLFRYKSSEWKERGIGDMKILKHCLSGKYRVVMRREQVLKLCANHHISEGMRLTPQGTSHKSWMWIAMDFSESSSEPQKETFAVKFKTSEEATEFHNAFVDGVSIASRSSKTASNVSSTAAGSSISSSQAAHAFVKKELREKLIGGTSEQNTVDGDTNLPKTVPNKVVTTKESKFILQFGTGMAPIASPSSGFSFGTTTTATSGFFGATSSKFSFGTSVANSTSTSSAVSFGLGESEKNPSALQSTKQHPTLQRVSGSIPASSAMPQYRFGTGDGNINSFSASTSFADLVQSDKAVHQQSDDFYDEDYDDESDTTETTESYSDSQDDEDEEDDYDDNESENNVTHQSPMNRFGLEDAKPTVNDQSSQSFVVADKGVDYTKPSIATSQPFLFGSSAEVSFGQLATSSSGKTFSFQTSAGKFDNVWKPDSKPMFSNQINNLSENPDVSSNQDEKEDSIHVKPIVDLPPLVVVETGEENETTLFSKRSKLYRWDKDSKQWKERGIGDIMIKHNTSSDRFRILMRREQVLKVCANHYITADMEMQPSFGSTQAWTWLAVDYSEGEEKVEKLAARFKTPEIAREFKEQFDECQLLSRKRTEEKQSDLTNASKLISTAEKMKSELGFFKDKLSVKSTINLDKTITEGSTPAKYDPNIQLTPLVKQHEIDKEKQKEKSEEIPSDKIVAEVKADKPKSSLQLDQFVFKMENNSQKTNSALESDKKRLQDRNISVCSATSDDSQADNIHFEPIVPLPAKVTVSTGEENEQAVFEDRTKVYMFDGESKQWKERGLGKVRILQNLNDFKLRIVMRREQVLKVCLNQFIQDETSFEYKENSGEKVIVWTAIDFSDTEKKNGETLQFAMRFKFPESASQFLQAIDEGRIAFNESRLLDPISLLQDQSAASEQAGETGGDQSENQSPMKSPVKPAKPLFSFANVENPFTKKDVKIGNFVFGDPAKPKPASQNKFTFDVGSVSFDFGCTSTPISQNTEQNRQVPSKPETSKALFGTAAPGQGVFKFFPGQSVSSTADNPVKSCSPAVSDQLTAIELNEKADSAQKSELEDISESSVASSSSESSSTVSNDVREEESVATSNKQMTNQVVQDGLNNAVTDNVASLLTTDHETGKEIKNDDIVDEDVIIVWEAVPNDDQIKKAYQLQLPKTFFLYENETKEDFNSDEEDRILEYIRQRDDEKQRENVTVHDESKITYSFVSESEDASSQHLSVEEPSVVNDPSSVAQTTTTAIVESSEQPLNLFQSFANMSQFSFSAVAAATDNKHAFGSRVDDAFQVSDEKKMLFANQAEEVETGADYDPQYRPLLAELPPLVDVVTGEENEDVLFKERCKLYKFDGSSSSWKERGIGDMKVLHHKQLNSFRLVMRREQVLKICANHRILKEMSLIPHSEKSWMYVAQDIGDDGQVSMEKFVLKFKTLQIANQFKSVWDDAKAVMQ